MLHVLLYDQKYQKSSKRFPLRNLPVVPRFVKARTIYTLLCEHIERTVRPQAKAEVQVPMHGLSARLCSVPCRYTAGVHAFFSVSAQTSCTPATPLYAGVEPAHTRICSILSWDVFARVVSIKLWGETEFIFFALPAARIHLPRSTPCDSVAYAEGV